MSYHHHPCPRKEIQCTECGAWAKHLRIFKNSGLLCWLCYRKKVHIISQNQSPDSDYYALPPYYLTTIKIPIDLADIIEERAFKIYKKKHTRARYIIALIRHDLEKQGLIKPKEQELVRKREIGL